MKKTSLLFIILFPLLLLSCGPGELVDKKISDSYFISRSGTISYSFQGNWFEIGVTKCDADKNSFKVLSRYFAKDNEHVFYCGITQKDIDSKSFYVDNNVGKDKNYAYKNADFDNLEPIVGVDAATFRYLDIDTINYTWSKDKNNYYFKYHRVNVDYSSFRFLNKYFCRDRDSLYADIYGWEFISVKPNPDNIIVINNNYVRDDTTLYYVTTTGHLQLLKTHFNKFGKIKALNPEILRVNDKINCYGKYFKSQMVDAETFELSDQDFSYSRDKNNVYYDQEIVKDASPETYKELSFGYGKDEKNVFYKTIIIEGADPKSFREDHFQWKDDKHVYKDGKSL